MRSTSCLFLLLICTAVLTGCSQKEDDTLDRMARMLEEKAPFYWEQEAFHQEYIAPSGNGKAIIDVNRVEISEQPDQDHLDVFFRNSVRIELFNRSNKRLWTLTANEGLILPDQSFRFRKGVLLDLGDGFQLEADSLEINRKEKRFTSGPGFSLFTQVRLSEEDSTQFTVFEGDSITASYSFDKWEVKAPFGSLVNSDTPIAN